MATLKETYSNATALFTACPPPATPNISTIESLIWGRWAPYELCIDDQDAWEEWFKYLIVENWGRAEALFKSAELIDEPLKSFWKSTDTTGTITDTDTIRIENNREEAHATSGYNNSNNEASSTPGVVTTEAVTPGKITVTKTSDTPQSAVSNLTDGYMSGVQRTEESGSESRTTTPTGHDESQAETRSNYLDATSSNSSDTSQHSGSIEKSHNLNVSEEGSNVSQAELVLKYRETLANIRREVADLFKDAFVLTLGGEAY